jgi:hypothetical protein
MAQTYHFRFWRAVDRLGNALTGGDDDETISHRVARARARGVWWGRVACWGLDKVKYAYPDWADHCRQVLDRPNPTDATVPLLAPLKGDANETP